MNYLRDKDMATQDSEIRKLANEFVSIIQHQTEVISIQNLFTGLLAVENIFIPQIAPTDTQSSRIHQKQFGQVVDGVLHMQTEIEIKRMANYFNKMSLQRQVQEAMLIKEKEQAFTKIKFEPTINRKS